MASARNRGEWCRRRRFRRSDLQLERQREGGNVHFTAH